MTISAFTQKPPLLRSIETDTMLFLQVPLQMHYTIQSHSINVINAINCQCRWLNVGFIYFMQNGISYFSFWFCGDIWPVNFTCSNIMAFTNLLFVKIADLIHMRGFLLNCWIIRHSLKGHWKTKHELELLSFGHRLILTLCACNICISDETIADLKRVWTRQRIRMWGLWVF